jgi:hypothetical protein
MNSDTGKFVIALGLIILLLGVIIFFFHDKLHWIGNLPGDIKIERTKISGFTSPSPP